MKCYEEEVRKEVERKKEDEGKVKEEGNGCLKLIDMVVKVGNFVLDIYKIMSGNFGFF